MYYLLMIYFSIFNIYYLLPISHPLSMDLPFIFIIHHLSFIYYLSVVYYLSTLLSISHLYLCSPPFYLPTIYVSILYHLCISIICLSVCPYVGLVVEPCLTHAWVRTTLFMLKQVPSFHWHRHPSVHGMILYASYMWPSLLIITTKLVDFQGWCLLWSYCIEEEAGWVGWAMTAEVIQQWRSRNRSTDLSWFPMSLTCPEWSLGSPGWPASIDRSPTLEPKLQQPQALRFSMLPLPLRGS